MLVKLAIKNFFKRFHTFLICFGFFLLSIVIAALIFIGGMQLVLSIQPGDLLPEIQNYFLYDFKINGVNEILDLSIFERVYNDILLIAGGSSDGISIGLLIILGICLFVVFGAYKGSIAVVGAINRNKLKDKNTKKGILAFIIKLIIGAVFAAILTYLMSLWTWSGLIVLVIYLFVDALENIFTLHYVYFSNIKLKEMFKDKSVLKIMGLYLVSDLILIAIAVLLCLASPLIAVVIVVPLLAYNETNVTFTVVTYFKENIRANKLKK